MEADKVTESSGSEMDQTVKLLQPSDKEQTAPDFIPLHKSPSPIPTKSEPDSIMEKNGQKRIKIETDDGNCKKRRISTPEPSIVSAKVDDGVNISDEEYYLIVSNLPVNWTYVQIKNYLDQECGHVDEMEMLLRNNSQPSAIRLTFQNKEKCFDVYKKLEDKVVEDKTIEVKISDSYTTFPTESTEVSEQNESSKRCWRPDLDCWDTDPEGLYGLRPQFLKSLNITPPLNNMVHVTNFRCDKNELKEVMQLAGNVLMCCVVNALQKYAKVMYSHPLEAVQAISMLNGQLHYGNPLKLAMDKHPEDNIILPKGLANIGVGLGTQGRPIRNIVHEYQRFIKKQTTLLSPVVFSEIDFSDNNTVKKDDSEEIQKKIDVFIKTPVGSNIMNSNNLKIKNIEELSQDSNSRDGSDRSTPESQKSKPTVATKNTSIGTPSPTNSITKNGSSKTIPPLLATPALGSAPLHPLVRFGTHSGKGYVPPNLLNPPVPMHNPLPGPGEPFYRPGNPHVQEPRHFGPRPYMPMQRAPPFHPQAMPGPFRPGVRPQGPPANFSGPRPVNPGNRVTVKFSNLPPSTTFPLLCEQLAQCGQVMSVQLTTPGCAVATFGHPSHADRCIQNFNGMNVEGFIIEVSFV
uniref:RRM domain-containing protein n=1 Tax=Heliothis virescens TaxID=7102 RepID=A0A2A4JXV5_HELVI